MYIYLYIHGEGERRVWLGLYRVLRERACVIPQTVSVRIYIPRATRDRASPSKSINIE